MISTEADSLLSSEMSAWVAAHLHEEPHRLALQRFMLPFPQALAVGQVALLQKAASKLPKMVAAQCILQQRAFEQSTSEALTGIKPWGKGKIALDLTCGLGSDSFALTAQYEKVISLEPNSELIKIVKYNSKLLQINNLQLINLTAEEFLLGYDGPVFDLVYADPDRRDESGKRTYGLQDCQPDMLNLMPLIRKISKRILIKASPMLDILAIQKQFEEKAFISVLSEANECKEILIEPDSDKSGIGAIFFRKGQGFRFDVTDFTMPFSPKEVHEPSHIFEADTALYKAGIASRWFASSGMPGGMQAPEGFYFSKADNPAFHGHRFRILADWQWKPQEIKRTLKMMGISKIQYTRRDFDIPMGEIRKQIGISEGGELFLLLTRMKNRGRWAYLTERLI